MGGSIVLDIPFYSQHSLKDEKWRTRACGPASLLMVMDYHTKSDISLDELVEEGEKMDGFGKSGWIHNVLLAMAKKYNYKGEQKEYKDEKHTIDDAIKDITKNIEEGNPIIVSAIKNFQEESKFHLVVITGMKVCDKKLCGFFYNDPDKKNEEEGKNIFVDILVFREYFRLLSIFVSYGSF